MKKPVEFECDCEAMTTFEYEEPTELKPTLVDFMCNGCRSCWQARFRKDIKGVHYTHRLVRGTAKLGDVLNKKAQHKFANAPQKKSPIWVVPQMPQGLKR